MSTNLLSLAEVGVRPMVEGPLTMWLTEDQARVIGFTDDEIRDARMRALSPPP